MNPMFPYAQGPVLSRMGEVLFHSLWEGALVALALTMVLALLRRGPATARSA